jgi:hypothetical protein
MSTERDIVALLHMTHDDRLGDLLDAAAAEIIRLRADHDTVVDAYNKAVEAAEEAEERLRAALQASEPVVAPPAEPASGPFPQGEAWIGVDLDGTLAHYDGWVSPSHIGPPVLFMLNRVRRWRSEGRNVAIFTARVSQPEQEAEARAAVEAWCREHLGEVLPVTNRKDFAMVACWDDRATQVIPNVGTPYVAPPPEVEP